MAADYARIFAGINLGELSMTPIGWRETWVCGGTGAKKRVVIGPKATGVTGWKQITIIVGYRRRLFSDSVRRVFLVLPLLLL